VDILSKVRSIESTLASRFDTAAKRLTKSGPREPLEIVHAIVDAIAREIQSSGRGKYAFPFNSIQVSVLAQSREVRDRLHSVLEGEAGVRRRIEDKLRSAGCRGSDVAVTISYTGRAQATWRDPEFHVKLAHVEVPQPATEVAPTAVPRVELSVLRGSATRRTSVFVDERIDLGRCAEVKDSAGRLIRTNDLAFVEGAGEVNQSVSRQHAHIARQPGSHEFRLYDDGSVRGTHIVRNGKTVSVPRGSRGVRLQSGDEIGLGDARLRIRINPSSAALPPATPQNIRSGSASATAPTVPIPSANAGTSRGYPCCVVPTAMRPTPRPRRAGNGGSPSFSGLRILQPSAGVSLSAGHMWRRRNRGRARCG
jgi:pSer/pThr/pTyr-binding forkhead associated (FHA) protein